MPRNDLIGDAPLLSQCVGQADPLGRATVCDSRYKAGAFPMYIRATKTHIAGGQPGYSFRLVRSERRGDRVRQRTLLSGRALARAPLGGGFPALPFRLQGGFSVPPSATFPAALPKIRTSGFPTVRLQAAGTLQFGTELSAAPPRLRLIRPCPRTLPAFSPSFDDPARRRGTPPLCAAPPPAASPPPVPRGPRRPGYVVPDFLAYRPHPPVRRTPGHFPASAGYRPRSLTFIGSSCLSSSPSGLSLLFSPGLPPSIRRGTRSVHLSVASVPALAIG